MELMYMYVTQRKCNFTIISNLHDQVLQACTSWMFSVPIQRHYKVSLVLVLPQPSLKTFLCTRSPETGVVSMTKGCYVTQNVGSD